MLKWEIISDYNDGVDQNQMARAKVFGGWIIKSHTYSTKSFVANLISESMVFMPDPNHEWKIEGEKDVDKE